MQRRRFLELTALSATAATSTALAGCTGTGSGGTGGDSETTTTTGTTTTTMNDDTTTDDTTTDDTTTDDSDDSLPCPNVRDVDRHVCISDDVESPAVSRTEREISADGGVTRITIENRADSAYGLNPYAWHVHRQVSSGDWELVDDDRAYIEPWVQMKPDSGITWRVATDADNTGSNDDEIQCALDLDPGTYVWSVELQDQNEDRFAVVVPFRVT